MHTVHVCCTLSNVCEISVSQALSTKRTLVSGGQANVSFLHAKVGMDCSTGEGGGPYL